MPLYDSHRATKEEVTDFGGLCRNAQDDYYGIVGKKYVTWTPELEAGINEGNARVWVCPDLAPGPVAEHLPLGGMVMVFHQPGRGTVLIQGMATRRNLPREQRIDVGLSLLIGGLEECLLNGCVRGRGHIEASNDILLETFQRVDKKYREIQEWGRSTMLPAEFRGVVGHRVDVKPLDDKYLAALHAALGP